MKLRASAASNSAIELFPVSRLSIFVKPFCLCSNLLHLLFASVPVGQIFECWSSVSSYGVNHRWQNRPLRYSHYGHDDQLSATAEESDGAAPARSSPQEDARVASCPGHHQVHQRPSTRGLLARWLQFPKSQPLQREEQLQCVVI